ncbi:MAG: inositol monophosphatase [Phycisphaeraceae bacterium]
MSMDAVTSPESWARRLLALGEAVRAAVTAARGSGAELALPVAQEGGDTIFAVDRHVEPVIERAVAQWPDTCKPVLVVAEGFGRDGRRLFEAKKQAARGYRVMIDPIDGTRNVMYDKRSAWFIAMVAEDRGEATRLDDALAAVMVELPTSKAGWFDVFGATCDGAAWGRRAAVEGGAAHAPLPLQPSRAATLEHGFAQVANFFPGTKVLAAELMERIVEASVGPVTPGAAAVFDDQYITTAGQMVELMMGRDRFCCDLRPLFYDAQMRVGAKKQAAGGAQRGLVCHPYDVAGALVARRAGVILTDGFGRALDAPLDVHSAVHWCGYANERLRECIEPVIQQWLRERGVHPG